GVGRRRSFPTRRAADLAADGIALVAECGQVEAESAQQGQRGGRAGEQRARRGGRIHHRRWAAEEALEGAQQLITRGSEGRRGRGDRKSTRLNSSHVKIS